MRLPVCPFISGFILSLWNPAVTGEGEENGAFLLAWGWSPSHLSQPELGMHCRVWGDSHSRRGTAFRNSKRAEVLNTRGWVTMFSTVRGEGQRWMSTGKRIRKLRVRAVWARESTWGSREQRERRGPNNWCTYPPVSLAQPGAVWLKTVFQNAYTTDLLQLWDC